jgi:hypothetical protein
MTFYPGIGALYGFAEGKRGSFAVRPDQVSFQMPENPPVAPEVASVQEKEVSDATVDGQDPQV